MAMGLFNLFRNQGKKETQKSDDHTFILQGPKYLRKFLIPPKLNIGKISNPKIEWTGQLISSTGNTFFELKYFGTLLKKETIMGSDELVCKVVAIDTFSGEEILLFDKAFHGYDGFIAEAYNEQRSILRSAETSYISKDGSNNFQIIIKAYYNYGTQDTLKEFANEKGQIELNDRVYLNLQDAFDDAFDALLIYAVDESGNKYLVIEEELA